MSSNLIIRNGVNIFQVMISKAKPSLLNSLINTDFLFLNKQAFLKNLYAFNLVQLKKKKIYLLNPLGLVQGFKQFIRVIQLLKKAKYPLLNFFLQDRHQKFLVQKFWLFNKVAVKFKFFFKFLVLLRQKKEFQVLLFLKDSNVNLNLLAQTLLNKQILLIQKITVTDTNNLGVYTIKNDLSDYKKLLFLLVLIFQALKSSTRKIKKIAFKAV